MITYPLNSHKMNDVFSCYLKYALNYEYLVFEKRPANHQITGDEVEEERINVPEMGFSARGIAAHKIPKSFFTINYKSPRNFLNAAHFIWPQYLEKMAEEEKDIIFTYIGNLYDYPKKLDDIAQTFVAENWDKKHIYRGAEMEKEKMWLIDAQGFFIALKGRLDMFRETDKGPLIRDYKSTYWKEDFNPEQSSQLSVYSYIVEKLTKKRPLIEVYCFDYGNNHSSQRIFFQFTNEINRFVEERAREATDRIITIRKDVRDGGKIEPTYTPKCDYCSHAWSGGCDLYTGNNMFELKGIRLLNFMPPSSKEEVKKKKKRKPVPKEQIKMKFRPYLDQTSQHRAHAEPMIYVPSVVSARQQLPQDVQLQELQRLEMEGLDTPRILDDMLKNNIETNYLIKDWRTLVESSAKYQDLKKDAKNS
ncbi:MAG: PD-(D/E)XK nuclease family protein [Candidatus Aenigmarchaeota archaeon]|nr:PD-(D/E)XK nuclease family protein [Candidatus Aenigmarchaeota archaeon]